MMSCHNINRAGEKYKTRRKSHVQHIQHKSLLLLCYFKRAGICNRSWLFETQLQFTRVTQFLGFPSSTVPRTIKNMYKNWGDFCQALRNKTKRLTLFELKINCWKLTLRNWPILLCSRIGKCFFVRLNTNSLSWIEYPKIMKVKKNWHYVNYKFIVCLETVWRIMAFLD